MKNTTKNAEVSIISSADESSRTLELELPTISWNDDNDASRRYRSFRRRIRSSEHTPLARWLSEVRAALNPSANQISEELRLLEYEIAHLEGFAESKGFAYAKGFRFRFS